MAREGGYGKSTKAEWIKTDRGSYGEALTSSAAMGQDLETWVFDAIAFYAYHCESVRLEDDYKRDLEAAANPCLVEKAFYTPKRPKPTMSQGRTAQYTAQFSTKGGPSNGR